MSNASKQAADVLRGLSGLARAASGFVPGIGAPVTQAIAQAIGLAADLADAGMDPADGIRRIRDHRPLFAAAKKAGWDVLEQRFPSRPNEREDIYE